MPASLLQAFEVAAFLEAINESVVHKSLAFVNALQDDIFAALYA